MRRYVLWATLGSAGVLFGACNSGVPEPASVELSSLQVRLTVVRVATDPFLSRHNLRVQVEASGGCSASEELFPDTGHAGRRNVYGAPDGLIYLIGQFDARVVNIQRCTIALSEFRHLRQEVIFLGSFDEGPGGKWTFLTPGERPEQPFDKR